MGHFLALQTALGSYRPTASGGAGSGQGSPPGVSQLEDFTWAVLQDISMSLNLSDDYLIKAVSRFHTYTET